MKDDSGAYGVFTEQGSSASQMAAAKVVDVIVRRPDCDGQAADAISACTPTKTRRCSKVAQNSEVRVSRHMDTCSTTQICRNHGQTLKIQRFLQNEICTDSSRKFCWNSNGRKYRTGNADLFTGNKVCSYLYTWMTLK